MASCLGLVRSSIFKSSEFHLVATLVEPIARLRSARHEYIVQALVMASMFGQDLIATESSSANGARDQRVGICLLASKEGCHDRPAQTFTTQTRGVLGFWESLARAEFGRLDRWSRNGIFECGSRGVFVRRWSRRRAGQPSGLIRLSGADAATKGGAGVNARALVLIKAFCLACPVKLAVKKKTDMK